MIKAERELCIFGRYFSLGDENRVSKRVPRINVQRFEVQVISFDSSFNIICKIYKLNKMENINSFIQSLTVDDLYRTILINSSNIYSIRLMKLENITPLQVSQHLQKIDQKEKETNVDCFVDHFAHHTDVWNNNELKIFSWISICYSYLKKKSFSQFENQDYQFLKLAFPHKSRQFLCYNLKILSKEDSIRRSKWSQEEIDLLKSIMKQQAGQYRWTHISFQLFTKSNGLFLQIPQQCREQWINHLNPVVNKESWSLAEDVLLFQLVVREGTRWSSISKMFDGSRTERMVKNRYKSIIHKNQNKTKKISQKKLSEKILLLLEQQLRQAQLNHLKKKVKKPIDVQSPHRLIESVETLAYKNMVRLETETQLLMKPNKAYDKQIGSDMRQQSMQNGFEIKLQNSTRNIEMMEVVEYHLCKSEQDNYIQSLLL